MGMFSRFSCGSVDSAINYIHELSGLENWPPLQQNQNYAGKYEYSWFFLLILPSKFIPEEQLRTVWPRPMIPVSTCSTTGTKMCEIPLSLLLLLQGPMALCDGEAAAAT